MAARLSLRPLSQASPQLRALPRASALVPQRHRNYATQPERRTAIVTGSSRGIGKAIALRLANDGYDVCINDVEANKSGSNEVVKEIQRLGRKAFAFSADVSDRQQVKDMVQASVKELGPLNTMIANAGIIKVQSSLDITEQDLKRMFDVNVGGMFNCHQAAAQQLISQGSGGKLIAAASMVAFRASPLLSHYSASKFAVRGLTQAFALEMARHNITVNAYAPGIVGTAMWDQIDAEIAKITGAKKGESMKKHSEDLILLGRPSVPEDVASTVSFLASKDSDYMTGQTILVDGGIFFS